MHKIVRAPLHTIFEVDDELRRRYEEDGMRQCALCLEHCSQRCSVCKLPYCSSVSVPFLLQLAGRLNMHAQACQLDDWEMSHEKECSAYKILTEINNSPFGQLAETREWDSEEEEDEDGCPCGHCY